MEPIVLASSSPRRKEILQRMGVPFIVVPASIDETYPDSLDKKLVPGYIAEKKVSAVLESQDMEKSRFILGADTVILSGGKIIGKPSSPDEAASFMRSFQGCSHEVITGVSLYDPKTHGIETCSAVSRVTFAPMSENEIEWYVSTGEWKDAAGGYKIQGKASFFISNIEGSESCIMGLPIFDVYDMLKMHHFSFAES